MSATPRTDAAWSSGFDPVVVSAAELARRLKEQCAELERENAVLRQDKEILDWMNNNIQAVMFKYKPDGFTWDFREIIGDAMSKEAKL